MKYRALKGQRITWPVGGVRAEPGQVFEGYDTEGNQQQRALARRWLRGQWTRCVPVSDTDAPDAVGNEMPPDLKDSMRALQAVVETRELFKPPTLSYELTDPEA